MLHRPLPRPRGVHSHMPIATAASLVQAGDAESGLGPWEESKDSGLSGDDAETGVTSRDGPTAGAASSLVWAAASLSQCRSAALQVFDGQRLSVQGVLSSPRRDNAFEVDAERADDMPPEELNAVHDEFSAIVVRPEDARPTPDANRDPQTTADDGAGRERATLRRMALCPSRRGATLWLRSCCSHMCIVIVTFVVFIIVAQFRLTDKKMQLAILVPFSRKDSNTLAANIATSWGGKFRSQVPKNNNFEVKLYLSFSGNIPSSEIAQSQVAQVQDALKDKVSDIETISCNMSAAEDIYTPSIQDPSDVWVNGPNRQFEISISEITRRSPGTFVFLMEQDTVPVKDGWLTALMEEIDSCGPFAILGRWVLSPCLLCSSLQFSFSCPSFVSSSSTPYPLTAGIVETTGFHSWIRFRRPCVYISMATLCTTQPIHGLKPC